MHFIVSSFAENRFAINSPFLKNVKRKVFIMTKKHQSFLMSGNSFGQQRVY